MKAIVITLMVLVLFNSCNKNRMIYPDTKTVDQADDFFGTKVSDPYRWLEDDLSQETASWVAAQNQVTFSYLEKIPFRGQVNKLIESLWNYEKFGIPFKKADKYYFYKNDGLQNQFVLFVQDSLEGEARVFLDPNTFSSDGTIALAGIDFSKNGKLCAYSISEGGSDWQKIVVMDPATKAIIGDTLKDVKFSGISWFKDDGFYYSSYDKPTEGSQLSGITMKHKVYYHKIGTSQADDQLVFGGDITPRRYIWAGITEDEKFLVISAAESTSGSELYLMDLEKRKNGFIPMATGFENDHGVIHAEGRTIYIFTNLGAPNYRVMTVDADQPDISRWKELIPEKKDVLTGATVAGNKLFLSYLKDATTRVFQYTLDGTPEREITFPTLGTAGGFDGKKEDRDLFYVFTSFTYPSTIFRYNIETGISEVFKKPTVKFRPEQYETRQVFYESKDGTKIPMFIVHKKDISKNGKNPLLLYGYGGFNISETPAFSVKWLSWLEMGGIFALPNLRGGGEYGKKWHEAGMKTNKQNVFDDFIAAAEYLHHNGYGSPQYTAIHGGSNGGLLVGAVMTQRPDICKVALPAVGVLDILRYHQFTAGAGWITDYGCADSSKLMFDYLYAYSPLHNIRENTSYPATLVTTADHDDRVVPAHSFKFAATLQAKQAGDNPVLIRIETKAGHGAGKPTYKALEEITDIFSFAFYTMHVDPVIPK